MPRGCYACVRPLCFPANCRCTCCCCFCFSPSPSYAVIVMQCWSHSFRHSHCLTDYMRPLLHTHRCVRAPPASATFLHYTHPAVLGSSGSVALLASPSIAQSSSLPCDRPLPTLPWLTPPTLPFHSPLRLCALSAFPLPFSRRSSIVPHDLSFSLDVPFYFLLFTTSRVKPCSLRCCEWPSDRLSNPRGPDIRVRHLLYLFSTAFVSLLSPVYVSGPSLTVRLSTSLKGLLVS